MSIILTSTEFKSDHRNFFPRKHQVKCDFCNEICKKEELTPGEAAEAARTIGWATVRTGKIGAPRKWACPECLKKKETFGC